MRLVVADDAAIVREGLRRTLADHGFEVVAAAGDADAAVRAAAEHRPDVVLLDLRMPPSHTTDGVAAAARIQAREPATGVLVLSQYADAEGALALLADGRTRCGYLLKERITIVSQLAAAIRRVAAGEIVVDPEIVEALVERSARDRRLGELTDREREVLALMAEGLTDRGIAERLWVTPRTVETHVRHILMKLDLPEDRTLNRRVLAVLTALRDQGLP